MVVVGVGVGEGVVCGSSGSFRLPSVGGVGESSSIGCCLNSES